MLSWVRFKTLVVFLTSALAVYGGILNLSQRISWKLPTDGIHWAQEGRAVVASATPAGQTEGNAVTRGDQLISVNSVPIRTLDDYTEVMELIAPEQEDQTTQANYVFRRGSEEFRYRAHISLQSQISASDYFLILTAAVFLVIGLGIYIRSGKSVGAFHFYLMCLVAFVLFMYRHSGRADGYDILFYWVSAVALLLLPPLFVHFCCYFPDPLGVMRRNPHLKPVLYFPFVLLLATHLAWFLGQLSAFGLPRNLATAALIDRVHLFQFLVYFGLGAFVLVHVRRRSLSVRHRQQTKWLAYGTVVGIVPFVLLYGVPYLVGAPIYLFMNASILGLALIPMSFGYAITRFRLMDVDVIVKRGAAYVLASSALIGAYLLTAVLIGRAVSRFSPDSGLLIFAIAALAGAVVFAPLKNKIQVQIDRLFYKEEYDYRQSLADFGRTLASETDVERLIGKICSRVEKTLKVPQAALFVKEPGTATTYQLFDPSGESPVRMEVPDSVFSDFDRELNPIFFLPSTEWIERLRENLQAMNLHYVQPLKVHGRVLGFLALTRRANGEYLSSEDLELVSSLATYAGIALDNAMLYESLELKANQLAQLKQYNEQVIESLIAGVAVVTVDGRVTVWNTALERISGISRAEAMERNIDQVLPEPFVRTIHSLLPGPDWTVNGTVRLHKTCMETAIGGTCLLNISVTPFLLNEEILTGTLLIFEDVTEKARLEDQLLQSEKLSSIGLFAAGVAHEVNTPLAGISSYTQMLIKELPEGHPQRELLKKIETQSFRASNIVNSLLKFARVGPSEVQEVNLNSVMLDTLSLLDHQFRKANVDVEMQLDPSLPATVGNSGKLQQVFMNLFLNAKDAMPEGGQLKIKTYHEDSTLMVQVKDTGNGISEQDIKRIYDPFFTTKAVGKGTGLGLSVSYGIIQEHSGRINVESEPGKGTTFTLQLPLRRVN